MKKAKRDKEEENKTRDKKIEIGKMLVPRGHKGKVAGKVIIVATKKGKIRNGTTILVAIDSFLGGHEISKRLTSVSTIVDKKIDGGKKPKGINKKEKGDKNKGTFGG